MSDKTPSFTAKLLNGAIAGSVGTCCVFPLDLAKTRIQDQRTVSKAGAQVTRLYKNVFHCMYLVARTEGIRGLYKGLGINLVLVNPEKALKLAVNDQARQYLGARQGYFFDVHGPPKGGMVLDVDIQVQVIVTTPMEFLKIQMQVSGRNAAGESAGPSATKVAMDLIKQKGIAGVYKGLGATIIRDVPFSMLYFPGFAFLNSKGYGPDGSKPHPVHSLVCGLAAGMVSAGAVTPLDVIKTRLQVLNRMEGEPVYNGFLDAAAKIFKNEGVSAFFKGAVPRMIVVAPLFGIAQMVYFIGIAEKLIDKVSGSGSKNKYD